MAEERPPQAEDAGQVAPSTEASTPPPTRTPEEVEAEWQARQSALGRQHAAEAKALRDQIAALEAAKGTATAAAQSGLTEAETYKQALEDAKRQLQEQGQQYEATLRATKYPYAAESLDPQTLAAMDEAKLAGLDARLRPTRPGVGIDPSTPQRQSSIPRDIEDKSLDELRADLERYGPQFATEINANRS